MGLFQRFADILKANINRMLDQAEDPEMVLEQMIQEMQESYRRAKIEVAKALADEKRLKGQMQLNQDTSSKWGRKALLAVERSDDDLAREALKRKRSYEDLAREFEVQWNEQKKVTDILRENLFGLENKIDEARRKKSLLAAKQRRAIAQKKLQDTLEQATGEQTYTALGQFEDKLSEIEARTEAELNLMEGAFDGKFRELERAPEGVEDELLALKLEVKGRKEPASALLEPNPWPPEAPPAEPPAPAPPAEPPSPAPPAEPPSPAPPPPALEASAPENTLTPSPSPEIGRGGQDRESLKRSRIEGAI